MLLYCFVLLTPSVISASTTGLPPSTAGFVTAVSAGTAAPVHLDDFDMPLYNGSGSESTLDEELVYLGANRRESSSAITNAGNQINDLRSDVNDFVGLIPVEQVRNVIENYYRNNKDIRLAFTYLKDSRFLKRLLNVTEIQHLVRYLNESGLDVVDILERIVDIIEDSRYYDSKIVVHDSVDGAATLESGTEYGGIHVMVDSVLEVVPQDEILNMFFEKMDTSPAFMMLFNKVREPKFGLLLHKLEESAELKYLIYTLHNHGINMEKIVDSLKNYFFLGTF